MTNPLTNANGNSRLPFFLLLIGAVSARRQDDVKFRRGGERDIWLHQQPTATGDQVVCFGHCQGVEELLTGLAVCAGKNLKRATEVENLDIREDEDADGAWCAHKALQSTCKPVSGTRVNCLGSVCRHIHREKVSSACQFLP